MRKFLPASLAAMLLFTLTAAFYQVRVSPLNEYDLFSSSIVSFDGMHINLMIDPGDEGSRRDDEEGGGVFYHLIFLLGSVTFVKGSLLLISLVPAAAVLFAALKRQTRAGTALEARLRYYRKVWSVRFQTPVQKFLFTLAYLYGINRPSLILAAERPVFCSERNTGFFFALKGEA